MDIRDTARNIFDGRKAHGLRASANRPACDFWSVMVYSMRTKAFVPNPLNRVRLSSYDKSKLQMNADGSADLYLGPTTPAGKEANWIPTGGEDFFVLFGLYGPHQASFDRTWKLADVEVSN